MVSKLQQQTQAWKKFFTSLIKGYRRTPVSTRTVMNDKE